MVTAVPTDPLEGEKEVIVGGGITIVYVELVVEVPAALVTEIVPEVAPAGTVAIIDVLLFTVNDAVVPLNETLVVPVKLPPYKFTVDPTIPFDGKKLVVLNTGLFSTT
jgi:hypothetical protein